MPAFYVVQQGAKLRVENRRLLVVLDEQTLASVPLVHVSQVVLFGNIGLTTPAISALLSENKEVIFLTQNGDFRGRLVGEITPHVPLRRAQYRCLDDPQFTLALAGAFVAAKLEHFHAFLQRHNQEKRDADIRAACDQLHISLDAISHKTELSALRGLEGAATRAYFGGYRRLFDPAWRFQSRNRRPPKDPVNVLLSFGYTLLVQDCHSAIQAVGLDPFAGFLHEYSYNRPSLALDMAEEFRAVVDGLVLWCCNSGTITLADFSPGPPERPVVLSDDGVRRFLSAYEKRLDRRHLHPFSGLQFPLRQCLLEQARQIAERLRSATPTYRGMGFR